MLDEAPVIIFGKKGNGDGFDLRRNEQLAEAAMEESDTGLLK